MRKPANVDELEQRLFAATDGIVACDAMMALSKLAKKGNEEAKSALAAYVLDGTISHVRGFACGQVAEAIHEPHPGFADVFRRGLADAAVRYWSILGYINSAGKAAYPELIKFARNHRIHVADRAHAIKCLSRFSKQRFDRGLPADPGFWKAKDLRTSELEAWASSGCPDGIEYKKPNRHPALDDPETEFEKIVQKLDKKLARERKNDQDLAEPTNWLVIADQEDINRVKARWDLPATYLDFLARFSPLRVEITNRKFWNSHSLFGAGELLEAQAGYSYDPDENQPHADWPPHLVVIASHGGDPYVLDLSRSNGTDAPILTAQHGTGEWKFKKAADSFVAFLEQLARS